MFSVGKRYFEILNGLAMDTLLHARSQIHSLVHSVPLGWQLSTSECHQSAFKHLEGHKQGFVTEQSVMQNLFVQKVCDFLRKRNRQSLEGIL